MVEINSRVKSLADTQKWKARAASLLAKLKATKVVWFPPEPMEAGRKTAASAKNVTKRAKKATNAGKTKTSGTKE